MNDRENRRYEMFVRVRDFGVEHEADFAPTSLGTQLFTQIGTIVDALETHGASQVSSTGTAKQGTVTRIEARQALRDDLEAISQTVRGMGLTGLDDKFRVPRGNNDQTLLAAARAFATDAAPYVSNFIAHELPANFIDDLNEDIEQLEAAMGQQSSGRGHRAAAIAAIDETVDDGMTTVKELHVIVKNKYRNNSAVLAQWTSAKHVERDPRHRQGPIPPSAAAGSSPPPAT